MHFKTKNRIFFVLAALIITFAQKKKITKNLNKTIQKLKTNEKKKKWRNKRVNKQASIVNIAQLAADILHLSIGSFILFYFSSIFFFSCNNFRFHRFHCTLSSCSRKMGFGWSVLFTLSFLLLFPSIFSFYFISYSFFLLPCGIRIERAVVFYFVNRNDTIIMYVFLFRARTMFKMGFHNRTDVFFSFFLFLAWYGSYAIEMFHSHAMHIAFEFNSTWTKAKVILNANGNWIKDKMLGSK